MDEVMAARYWCYQCNQMISPIMEVEIKCSLCQGGFVEEMSNDGTRDSSIQEMDSDIQSDRALSLWAPILLGMMRSSPHRRRRLRRVMFGEEDGDNSILQLLQGIRDGMASETENSENERDRDREQDMERERVILINRFNQTIVVQGSYDSNQGGQSQNSNHIGSIGDYFSGPGLDLLLQHLAENDPNRYGTPPAQKEAIEAMPTVKIKETLQCSVCLDDFEAGCEAKEMACKHKFHSGCILPWLELHSSCPVCRYQMPADESKLDYERPRSNNNNNNNNSRRRESESNSNVHHGHGNRNGEEEGEGEGEGDGRSGRRFSFPWPFNGLFTSGSQSSRGNSSSSQTDEN